MKGMVANEHFAELHRQMAAEVERQNKKGWSNPEAKRAAEFVLMSLDALAHIQKPAPAMLKALRDYLDELERARKQ